jgi:DNA-directed RNA polymerase subunit RPC12/RpoP
MENTKLSDYDALECPNCENPTKPNKIDKNGSVTYKCKECEQKLIISVNGELLE